MHPIRAQRLQFILFGLLASSIAAGLIVYSLRQNINYFYTPSQVLEGLASQQVRVRVGGMVENNSLERSSDSLRVTFFITDGVHRIQVRYDGILPDLFSEGEAAIVTGTVDDKFIVEANEVLAKHDENYMPPEVAEGMREAYISSKDKDFHDY